MCTGLEPALIAGAALSGAGSFISMNEQEKQAKRQAQARNAELEQMRKKNKALSDEAYSYFNERVQDQQAEAQQPQQEQLAADKSSEIAANSQAIPSSAEAIPLSGSAPKVVQNEMAKRLADTLAGTGAQANRLGQLGAYNQMVFGNSMKNQDTARRISIPSGFAQSNAANLPYYQDLAELNATKSGSGIGSLLKGAGYLVGSM